MFVTLVRSGRIVLHRATPFLVPTPTPTLPRFAGEGAVARLCRAFLSTSVFFVLSVFFLLSSASAQQRDEGERAFQKCYSCHSVDPKEKDLSGPNLAGVIGRRAASLPNFEYSPAMKKAGAGGLVWTEDTLERYLADPLEAVPGTTMGPVPLKDAAERRAVVAYLKRFR
jgi:cytochrome c